MTTATMPKKTNKPADDAQPFSKQVAFRILDRDLWEGVEALIAKQEFSTTFTDVMVIALREFLKKKGEYPRPKR
jgi:hypothetical protein